MQPLEFTEPLGCEADRQRCALALIAACAPEIDWMWLTDLLRRSRGSEGPSEGLQALVEGRVTEHRSACTLRDLWNSPEQRAQAHSTIARSVEAGLQCIDWDSPFYPETLRQIFRPPLVLFVRSKHLVRTTLSAMPMIAIVGSRKADSSGIRIARDLGLASAARGISVVSGLAFGIDAAAHVGALDAARPGATHAVLGHGHMFLYPRQHERLAEQILAQGGALISEYPLDQPPRPYQFIARNRIIAGLSRVVMVIQATKKSGSLATARFALEQGKDVLVTPGSIDDPRYEGSNLLLKDGAALVTHAEDIFSFFPDVQGRAGDASGGTAPQDCGLSPECEALLRFVRTERAVRYDQVAAFWQSAGHRQALEPILLDLELSGRIERQPGHTFAAR